VGQGAVKSGTHPLQEGPQRAAAMGQRGSKSQEPPSICAHPGLFGYLCERSLRLTPEQAGLYARIEALPKGRMAGSPDEAQFLAWLCELVGARTCVEVGVFRGSTTTALAGALPEGGVVHALDVTDEYVLPEAREAWQRPGRGRVDLRVGPATESLRQLLDEGNRGRVDLAFVDANKNDYDAYYELCLALVRPGGIVAVDNVLWHGKVLNPALVALDSDTAAIDALNRKILADERVTITMLPMADGLTLCRKR